MSVDLKLAGVVYQVLNMWVHITILALGKVLDLEIVASWADGCVL